LPRVHSKEKYEKKRKIIIDAARKVFSQNGYAETTLTKIAKEAGIPTSSIYNYFTSKREIFELTSLDKEVEAMRPAFDKRRQDILSAALVLFGNKGYSATTLSDIAGKVGMTKAALYQYFRSKEELFTFVLENSPLDISARNLKPVKRGKDWKDDVLNIGKSYLEMGNMPERTAIFKTVVRESDKFPEAGRLFYSEAISKVCESVADYLHSQLDNCPLDRRQLKLAAWLYLSTLWASNILFKVISGVERDFTDEEILKMSSEIFINWLEKFEK